VWCGMYGVWCVAVCCNVAQTCEVQCVAMCYRVSHCFPETCCPRMEKSHLKRHELFFAGFLFAISSKRVETTIVSQCRVVSCVLQGVAK